LKCDEGKKQNNLRRNGDAFPQEKQCVFCGVDVVGEKYAFVAEQCTRSLNWRNESDTSCVVREMNFVHGVAKEWVGVEWGGVGGKNRFVTMRCFMYAITP
jgi:hypothetical protein